MSSDKQELKVMNSDRIQQIQGLTAHPMSHSVQQALTQVWNECEQYHRNTRPTPPVEDGEEPYEGSMAEMQNRIAAFVQERIAPLDKDCVIDGSGCDSGDPVDLTLTEIGQGFTVLEDILDDARARLHEQAGYHIEALNNMAGYYEATLPALRLEITDLHRSMCIIHDVENQRDEAQAKLAAMEAQHGAVVEAAQ